MRISLVLLAISFTIAGCYQSGNRVDVDGGSDAGCVGVSALPPSTCGNGIVERAADPPEYCDDGNTNDTDLCTNTCTLSCLAPAPPTCDGPFTGAPDDCASAVCDSEGSGTCVVVRAPVGTPCTTGSGCVCGICTIAE